MLIFDLQTLLFALFLFLLAALGAGFWLARRHPARLPDGGSFLNVLDDAPFGVAALAGNAVHYANPYARRMLHLPNTRGALPDADWSPKPCE